MAGTHARVGSVDRTWPNEWLLQTKEFSEWLHGLRDLVAKARVVARLCAAEPPMAVPGKRQRNVKA